jgi:hypothetical protein
VLHHCDVRDCYEITHLFTGTQADNIHDMWAKGRQPTDLGKYERTAQVRDVMSASALSRWERMTAEERAELGRAMGDGRRGKRRGPYKGRTSYAQGYTPVGEEVL